MGNKLFIFITLTAISAAIAGCAACDTQRLQNLETRLQTLEKTISGEHKSDSAEISGTPAQTSNPAASGAITESTENISIDSPTKKDIQTALKNAGFYDGELDGKIGPKTKQAVEDFQTAQGLKADGRVGPNTWDKLKEHLNAAK